MIKACPIPMEGRLYMNRQENTLKFPIVRDARFVLIDTNCKIYGAYKAKEMRTHPDFELVRETNDYLLFRRKE